MFLMVGPMAKATGIPSTIETAAPTTPANAPSTAPSAADAGVGEFLTYRYVASMPPKIAQRQQQTFAALTNGMTDSKPRTTPPINAGLTLLFIELVSLSGVAEAP